MAASPLCLLLCKPHLVSLTQIRFGLIQIVTFTRLPCTFRHTVNEHSAKNLRARQSVPSREMAERVMRRINNNINSQLYATIANLIDNYNQLNMFRAIISPILRSTRLCLQLVV